MRQQYIPYGLSIYVLSREENCPKEIHASKFALTILSKSSPPVANSSTMKIFDLLPITWNRENINQLGEQTFLEEEIDRKYLFLHLCVCVCLLLSSCLR